LHDINVSFLKEDRRPAFVLDNVEGIDFAGCHASKANGIPTLVTVREAKPSNRERAAVLR